MGIKHFFSWFKNNFFESINKLSKNCTVDDVNVSIDNLMIDMNGIFHTSAQKIYEYGNYKTNKRLLNNKNNKQKNNNFQKQINLFEDVCKTIEKTLDIAKPKKKLILCIDGPAPLSKQNQQRQRRYRSAMETSNDCSFDSNCITPGTQFMDYLSKYIDWYIKNKISTEEKWQNIEIIFSTEKAPGEGEHKLINYMRYYGDPNDTFCIHGLDADLIMLALGTHLPNFYILREDIYDPKNEYFLINIGEVYDNLSKLIKWESSEYAYNKKSSINDFIFICFSVGNDFLPHIPSIEIIENGIELLLEVYKKVGSSYGHITKNENGKVKFITSSFKIFLATIGQYEQENFELKLRKKSSFFPDEILEKCAKQNSDGSWSVNIEKYKQDYQNSCFPKEYNIKNLCHEYLEGMQWVLSYYTMGVPNWKWVFKHHYAPPASVLAMYIDSFEFINYQKTIPTTPYQQLLCVLPPKSANLLPYPLNKLLTDKNSPLKEHCPEEFHIDLSGKRREWEGIVILPMVDFELVKNTYMKYINNLSEFDKKRNILGRTILYDYNPKNEYEFNSYYGNIKNCKVKTSLIDL
jgi:5'-3' exoribonuclease 1